VTKKLIQLPGNQWVDADRVSSIKYQERELNEPCVVVRTYDGEVIVVEGTGKPAREVEDDIAKMINEHRE